MKKLNILVLHALGNPKLAPRFLEAHVFSLQKNFPNHNYLYHDATLSLPEYVKQSKFDAILLDVTFLCARWASDSFFRKRLTDYAFVAQSDAVKLAFPQDEYDCHKLLDDWMCDWKIDTVFSVIGSNWDVLYPRFHKIGEIKLGYTGYIDESLLSWNAKPFEARSIDIGYRAIKLLPYFGRLGETKWRIGRDVAERARQANLKVDIVLGQQGTLLGKKWLEFINDSKFTLGANSGSSLLDPVGAIRKSVKQYLSENPDASFEQVELACFKREDQKHEFTAISPRVFEAALLGSCQILVDGDYSGIIRPWHDYIPIRADASNFSEVLEAMHDTKLAKKLIKNCRDSVLSVDALRYSNNAAAILKHIEDKSSAKNLVSSSANIQSVIAKYKQEMTKKYHWSWAIQVGKQIVKKNIGDSRILNYFVKKLY